MKKIVKGLFFLGALFFLVSTVISLRLLYSTYSWIDSLTSAASDDDSPYRFVLIAPTSADPFYGRLWSSIQEEARLHQINLEGYLLSYENNRDELLRYMELVQYSRADGLILYGIDDPLLVEKVNEIVDVGIPVVTVDVDLPYSRRQVFVGTSPYRFGTLAAQTIQTARGAAGGKIGVIISQSEGRWSVNQSANLIAGLRQGLSQPGYQILAEDIAPPGLFSSEESIRKMLGKNPEINIIYCSSSLATLSAAHSLVDMNQVGNILLLGTDDHPELRNYIARGVIHATLLRDPLEMGRLAVRSLLELMTEDYTSAFMDPGLSLMDAGHPWVPASQQPR